MHLLFWLLRQGVERATDLRRELRVTTKWQELGDRIRQQSKNQSASSYGIMVLARRKPQLMFGAVGAS